MTGEPMDFGSGVTGYYVGWAPDRELNPQYAHLADVDRYGLVLDHPDARDGTSCTAACIFDGPVQAQIQPDHPRWTVEAWEPLTLSPSVLCTESKGGCGLHGYIRDGQWVPA